MEHLQRDRSRPVLVCTAPLLVTMPDMPPVCSIHLPLCWRAYTPHGFHTMTMGRYPTYQKFKYVNSTMMTPTNTTTINLIDGIWFVDVLDTTGRGMGLTQQTGC